MTNVLRLLRLVPAFTLACCVNLLNVHAQPNVLILFTDDQGTLDAHCYGSDDLHTPAIDSLAARGVRFTQAYSHTVCCPARAALLTGRYPQRGGINNWAQSDLNFNNGTNMSLSEVTLAEVLGQNGYRTALFGKWHLGAHVNHGPTCQGFGEFFGIRDGFIDNFNHYYLHRGAFHDLYEGTREVFFRDQFFPELMVNRALRFLEASATSQKEEPFFLYVPFNIPHYPEQAPDEDAARYSQLEEPRRSYASFVTTTDRYIGQILSKLEQLGLRDDTIVIFMSDNGHSEEDYQIRWANSSSGYPKGHNYGANGGGGNTGEWIGHKATFFEGGLRVPAIVSYPAKLPSGVTCDQVITGMDWFPTVLELCQIQHSGPKLDGHSLLPMLGNANAKTPYEVLHFQWQSRWCVRRGDWKLVQNGKNGKTQLSLHNLADSEPEAQDYAKEKPQLVEELCTLHNVWANDVFDGKPE